MTAFAEIALNINVNEAFTYRVPGHLAAEIEVGQLVHVPFRTGQDAGIVINLTTEEPEFTTKPVYQIIDERPIIPPRLLELMLWVSDETLAPIGPCLWLMIPPGLTPRRDEAYTLLDDTVEGHTPEEQRVISLLKRRGTLNAKKLTAILGKENWTPTLTSLQQQGLVEAYPVLSPPQAKPKTVRTAQLLIPPEQIDHIALGLGRESRRANVLEVLLHHQDRAMPMEQLIAASGYPARVIQDLIGKAVKVDEAEMVYASVPDEELVEQIIAARGALPYIEILRFLADAGGTSDVSSLYTSTETELRHLKKLQNEGYVRLGESEVLRDSTLDIAAEAKGIPTLTETQQAVWNAIQQHISAQAKAQTATQEVTFLLHGVTGSGKTEIYLRAVAQTLGLGRTAIVMVPEIALTTQMVKRFSQRFPNQVGLVHSTLSTGERYDTWRRARDGDLKVVIGARSALFTPLPDVGLIVMDEEHDSSYKQAPPINPPYYHARDIAIEYMRRQGGTVIMGSATPDVATYYHAQIGNYRLLEMPDRIAAHQEESNQPKIGVLELPPVEIIDMRQELRAGHTKVFSRQLMKKLARTLSNGEQAILFLNRRGTATYVFCRDCGYIAKCPNCDTPLTFHTLDENLQCHHCGYQMPNLDICPACESRRIKFFGRGTEQLERLLWQDFPQAKVLRWDRDTASSHKKHRQIYEAFADRQADILVGTQMIAKGLDLPYVTLVGIVSGDTALGLPDFRAGEVTFQLLTQVAGRAGRGTRPGEVILQTYQPEHYAIQAAAEHDYHRFYEYEIRLRQQLGWAPFIRLGQVLLRDPIEDNAQREGEALAQTIQQRINDLGFGGSHIIGPVPCFFHKQDTLYRWQILVRSSDPAQLLRGLPLRKHSRINIDPMSIL